MNRAEGATLLPPDAVARRVDRETFVLLGGHAALLLQVAHPLVAAGVDRHSDFRRDPLGRLRRTLDTTLAAVFGDGPRARRALRRIDRRHAPVTGVGADGRPYSARDPQLMLWVQCTLVLTSLRLYEAVRGRLPDADRERYWDDAKKIARELGIPDTAFPRALADLERYERAQLLTAVVPDATSRAVARDVLRPLRRLPGFAYWPLDAFTASLLPASIRGTFGLRWRRRERLWSRFVIVALRLGVPLLPARLRLVPQARGIGTTTRPDPRPPRPSAP